MACGYGVQAKLCTLLVRTLAILLHVTGLEVVDAVGQLQETVMQSVASSRSTNCWRQGEATQ